MRVGQQGTLTRLWAPTGTRPRVVRQQQYTYAYVFGAVCPARDEAVGLILPTVNLEAMTVYLQTLSAAVLAGRHALVVVDGAGWHGPRVTAALPTLPCLNCHRPHPNSTRPSKSGSSFVDTISPTDASATMRILCKPVVKRGMRSPAYQVLSASYVLGSGLPWCFK